MKGLQMNCGHLRMTLAGSSGSMDNPWTRAHSKTTGSVGIGSLCNNMFNFNTLDRTLFWHGSSVQRRHDQGNCAEPQKSCLQMSRIVEQAKQLGAKLPPNTRHVADAPLCRAAKILCRQPASEWAAISYAASKGKANRALQPLHRLQRPKNHRGSLLGHAGCSIPG